MADNINKSNIDDIVSGVRKTLEAGEVSGGGISFEFVEDEPDNAALVFEVSEPEEKTEEIKQEEPSEPEKPVADTEEKTESAPTSEKTSDSAHATIWTTYVPRFTEVSENYRMKSGDSFEEAPVSPVKKERELPISVSDEPDGSEVDPTAEPECETVAPGATIVTSGAPVRDEREDVSTVFKFDNGVSVSAAEQVEEEKAEPQPIAEPIEEPSAEEISEEPEAVEEEEEKEEEAEEGFESPVVCEDKPYVMPDPVFEELKAELPIVKPVTALEVVDETVGKKKRSEYSSFSEKDGFLDSFIDSIMSVRVRIVSVIFVAFMLLLFENASFFGVNLIKVMRFEGVGGAMAIITLPFIAGLFLLAMPEVVYSFFALSRKKLVPEIFISVTGLVIVLYYVIIITFEAKDSYSLFGFMFAVITLLSLFSSYYKKKADFEAFKIASANGEKKVVDRKLTRNLPAEHRALDGKIESYKSRTARVFRTNFVSDFYARTSIISENTVGNVIVLSVTLGIALVAGVVAFFIPGGIVSAAVAFATVYMLSLPAFVIISHKIPFYKATAEAAREKSAVIGEKSFYDYSGIDVITFDDTEIFGKDDVNLQRIMVYGRKENLPKALQQMSALFTVVGGPLAYIFANAVDRRVSPADNVAVDTDGVIGAIDGVEIMAGSAEFMERRGIKIPYDPEGDGQASQTTRIMYASEGGEIYAKFYVRYMLSEEFTMVLPILLDEGVKPLVYTRDPNINDALFRSLTAGTDSIRVLKKQNLPSSEVRLYSRISLGMVTLGDKTNVINTILLSKKYAVFQSKFALAELPAMIVGGVVGILLAIFASAPISSLLLSLWYIGWSVAVSVFAGKMFGAKKEKKKDKED